jgi:flagellar motor switch protein FliM
VAEILSQDEIDVLLSVGEVKQENTSKNRKSKYKVSFETQKLTDSDLGVIMHNILEIGISDKIIISKIPNK